MSRKSYSILAAAALAAAWSASPALAYQITAPGGYQSLMIPAQTDWTPAQATLWTETSLGSNIWDFTIAPATLTVPAPAGHYAYKILNTPDAMIPDWGNSTQVTPADSWFVPKADGSVALHLDYTVPASPKWGFSGTWTPQLVGNFQNETGGASDWNPVDPLFNMTNTSGDLWEKTLTVATPGTYEVKITDGLGWSVRQFGANGYRDNATTFAFTTVDPNEDVDFTFNALLGTFSAATVVPTPPTWKNNASGEWNEPTNWLVAVPNAAGAEAVFPAVNDWPRTVYNDGGADVTVGKLTFNSPNTYQIVGNWGLILESADANPAQVNVLQGTHKINLPLTVASDTNINVATGATLKISDPVTIAFGVNVSETGTGTVSYESTVTLESNAIMAMKSSQHMAALTVGAGATATLNSSGTKVLNTDALSISASGGKVDLTNNKMITKASTGWNGSDYTGVAAQVKSARNGGAWDGSNGITTSEAAAATGLTTLAVATASEVGKTTFGGQAVAAGDTLVMYTYNGDANLSGKVDADDYFVIDSNYNKSGSQHGFAKGDFNYDGLINGDDYLLIDQAYSGQGAPFSPGASAELGGVSAVPEPAGLSLAALAALGLLRRQRRS